MDIGSSAEGPTSTRLVLTITTDWLTWRKASRSCCAFVVIEIAQNVTKLSTKANGDLVLMVRREAQQLFQKVTQTIGQQKAGKTVVASIVRGLFRNKALVIPRGCS